MDRKTTLGVAIHFISKRFGVSYERVNEFLKTRSKIEHEAWNNKKIDELQIDEILSKNRLKQLDEEFENLRLENFNLLFKLMDHRLQLLREENVKLRQLQFNNNDNDHGVDVVGSLELERSFSHLFVADMSQSSDGTKSTLCQDDVIKYQDLPDKYWWKPQVRICFESYKKCCIDIHKRLKEVETLRRMKTELLEKLQKFRPIERTLKEEDETSAKCLFEGDEKTLMKCLFKEEEACIKPLFEHKDDPQVREMLCKRYFTKLKLTNELTLLKSSSTQNKSKKNFETLLENREHPKIKDLLIQYDSIQKRLYKKVKEVDKLAN